MGAMNLVTVTVGSGAGETIRVSYATGFAAAKVKAFVLDPQTLAPLRSALTVSLND